jgi:predicted branched-subunit amino acid permease
MFIGLLVGQCESPVRVITAILSGAIATLLYLVGWHQFYVIAATIAGATLGLWVELWIKR